MSLFLTRDLLIDFLQELDKNFAKPAKLSFVGETTFVFEGWNPYADQIEFASEVAEADRAAFDKCIAELQKQFGLEIYDESPADIIPLPDGYRERAVQIDSAALNLQHLSLSHFDPFSVAFRFIARGDEPDYHIVLMLIKQGWVSMESMNEKLKTLLTRFSFETIQQDPAEFRRKYKGLTQMALAITAGVTHRHTPA